MTKKECAIVMAYTGIAMLTGEDFNIYHKYIEDIMGRPVWTHELANESVVEEIKEKSKYDFLKLCEKTKYNDLTPMHQEPKTRWIPVSERLPEKDESVLLTICDNSALYGFNENFVKVMCGSYSPCEDERDWIVNGIRYYIDNVIAWCELPKPYSEVSE